ncbi:MAG TPA: hypothetical protein VFI47_28215 [Acidimicrobiales bacterium]|nr:hypothetical protein [Acidimicrobiales bacterium]
MLLVGTADGLLDLALDGTVERRTMPGAEVRAVSGDWAIAEGWVVALDTGEAVALPGGLVPQCITALAGGRALVGTSDARVVEVGGPGGPTRDALFDAVPARSRWTTPWGGPPDTRSVAVGPGGPLAGVHVGGVWRRGPAGWAEIVPVEADDHQVVAQGRVVAVAAAVGVGQSDDGGDTWRWGDEGLHAPYCRSVALAEGWLLAGASTGPATREGAVYRRPLADPSTPFARCGGGHDGLPRSFPHNVDTFTLAAAGSLVAVGTPTGDLYLSEDSGATWRRPATTLPGIHCVEFAT